MPRDRRGDESAHPFTPRYYVSYQVDDKNLLYASASKGFRIGGANKPIPTESEACTENLAEIGYGRAPRAYDPDSLWSYEIGSKNGALDGRLQVNSSLFYIKWSNIQQSIEAAGLRIQFRRQSWYCQKHGRGHSNRHSDHPKSVVESLGGVHRCLLNTSTVSAGGTNPSLQWRCVAGLSMERLGGRELQIHGIRPAIVCTSHVQLRLRRHLEPRLTAGSESERWEMG